MGGDKRKHRGGDENDLDFVSLRGDAKKELLKKVATGGSLLVPLIGWLFMMHNNMGELERDVERRLAEQNRIDGELRADVRSNGSDIRRVSQDIAAQLDVIKSTIGDRYNSIESNIHGEATRRGTADADIRRQIDSIVASTKQTDITLQRLERQQDFSRFPGYGQSSVPMRKTND